MLGNSTHYVNGKSTACSLCIHTQDPIENYDQIQESFEGANYSAFVNL